MGADAALVALYTGAVALILSDVLRTLALGPELIIFGAVTVLLATQVKTRAVASVPFVAGAVLGVVSAQTSDPGDESPIGLFALWTIIGALLSLVVIAVLFVRQSR